MSEPVKPFACSVTDCGMSFTNEDHLNVHMKKHDMILQLGFGQKSGIYVADQTPTPTRFIRNCEEMGLFQDLQNVNPFDSSFKRAIESKSGMLILDNMTATPAEDLHTPHIFPNLETEINITKDLEDPKITSQTNKVTNDVIIHEKIELHTKTDGAPADNVSYTNSVIKMTHNFEIKNSNAKSDKPLNALEVPPRPTIMSQNSLEKAIESLSQEVNGQSEPQMDAFRMVRNYKRRKEYIHSLPTKKKVIVVEKPERSSEINQTSEPNDSNESDKYEVLIKLPSGEYVHLSGFQDEISGKILTNDERAKKAIKKKLMSKTETESGKTIQQKSHSTPNNPNFSNQTKNQPILNNLPSVNFPIAGISLSNKAIQNEFAVTNAAHNIKLVNLVSQNSCFLNSIPQGSLVPVSIVKSDNSLAHQSIKLPQTINLLQTPQPLIVSSCSTPIVNGAKLNEAPKVAIKALPQAINFTDTKKTPKRKYMPRFSPIEQKIRALKKIEQIEKDKLQDSSNSDVLNKLGDGNWSETFVRDVQKQFENIHKLHKKSDNPQTDHNIANDSAIKQKSNEELTDANKIDVRIDEVAKISSPVKNNYEVIINNYITSAITNTETPSEAYATGANENKSLEQISTRHLLSSNDVLSDTRESKPAQMSTSQLSDKAVETKRKNGINDDELVEQTEAVFKHKDNDKTVDTLTVESDESCEEVTVRRAPFTSKESRKAATARYRQRRKRLMESLQRLTARLGAENTRLKTELSAAKKSVATLQILILQHMKDCSEADALKQCYELVAKDISR